MSKPSRHQEDELAALIESAYEDVDFPEVSPRDKPWRTFSIDASGATVRKLLRAQHDLLDASTREQSERVLKAQRDLMHALGQHRSSGHSPRPRAHKAPPRRREGHWIGFDFGIAVGAGVGAAIGATGLILLLAAVSSDSIRPNPYTALAVALVGLSLFGTVLAAVVDRRRD